MHGFNVEYFLNSNISIACIIKYNIISYVITFHFFHFWKTYFHPLTFGNMTHPRNLIDQTMFLNVSKYIRLCYICFLAFPDIAFIRKITDDLQINFFVSFDILPQKIVDFTFLSSFFAIHF